MSPRYHMTVDKGTAEVPTDQASLTAIGVSFPLSGSKCSFLWVSFNCRLTAYSLYAAVSVGLQVRIVINNNKLIMSFVVFCYYYRGPVKVNFDRRHSSETATWRSWNDDEWQASHVRLRQWHVNLLKLQHGKVWNSDGGHKDPPNSASLLGSLVLCMLC